MTRHSSVGSGGISNPIGSGSTPDAGSKPLARALAGGMLSSARLPQGLRGPKSAIRRRAMT